MWGILTKNNDIAEEETACRSTTPSLMYEWVGPASTGRWRKDSLSLLFVVLHTWPPSCHCYFLFIYFSRDCVGTSLQLSFNVSVFVSSVCEVSQIFKSPFLIPRRRGKAISGVFGNCKTRTHCSTAAHVHLCSMEHAEVWQFLLWFSASEKLWDNFMPEWPFLEIKIIPFE